MAGMANGDGRLAAATYPGLGGSSDMTEQPIIQISQINLSGKQLWTVAVTIAGLITSGALGGILFMPAKQTDVTELTRITGQLNSAVETAKQDQAEVRQLVVGLSMAMEKISVSVTDLQGTIEAARETRTDASGSPETIARPKLRPKPKPRPVSLTVPALRAAAP